MAKKRARKKESAKTVKRAYEDLEGIISEYAKKPEASRLLIEELEKLVQVMRQRALELL